MKHSAGFRRQQAGDASADLGSGPLPRLLRQRPALNTLA
jgi:hypothetical protein